MEKVRFTVFGGSGFVGKALVKHLVQQGYEVFVPSRNCIDVFGRDLGHVVYSIGMTANFRRLPFETVDAHVVLLARLLKQTKYNSWLYLSSTRIYGGICCEQVVHEDTPIKVTPSPDSIYDISKLLGEALCLSQPSPFVRVARLSNVYGYGHKQNTFLASVIRDLQEKGQVLIAESPDSVKDYVALDDVIPMLEKIALNGNERIYNIASGRNISHVDIANKLTDIIGGTVTFKKNSVKRIFPAIDIERIRAEFGFVPLQLLNQLKSMLLNKED
jgi:nucleoside-diphosphate-sugar epimerase